MSVDGKQEIVPVTKAPEGAAKMTPEEQHISSIAIECIDGNILRLRKMEGKARSEVLEHGEDPRRGPLKNLLRNATLAAARERRRDKKIQRLEDLKDMRGQALNGNYDQLAPELQPKITDLLAVAALETYTSDGRSSHAIAALREAEELAMVCAKSNMEGGLETLKHVQKRTVEMGWNPLITRTLKPGSSIEK